MPDASTARTEPVQDGSRGDAYHEAQYLLSQRNSQSIQRAMGIFNGLLKTNARLGDAYAGLAECYGLGYWGFWKIDPKVAVAKSDEYARSAVQLAPGSAYAHAQLAASDVREWKFLDAQREFERSLALNPNDAEVHHAYAIFLDDTRRADAGIQEMRRAIELQPLSLAYKTDLGMSYFFARRYADAISEYKSVLRLDPKYVEARDYLASMYVFQGRWSEAKDEYVVMDRLQGKQAGDYQRTALRLITMLHNGEQKKAHEDLQVMLASPTVENCYYLADIYAQLGNREEALKYLRRVIESRRPGAFFIFTDPLLDPLRGSGEFESLSRQVLDENDVRPKNSRVETAVVAAVQFKDTR
jgi:tetratricopeptide (TPR) repeat protein